MSQLILELGCEDLPSRFVEPALTQLASEFRETLSAHRIESTGITTMGTPRRLILFVEDLALKQADLEEVRTGPPARAAFRDGEPTKAAQGFARGQGVAVEDLYTVETPKGEYVAAKVFEVGKATSELLPDILSYVLEQLSFPKSMKWGARRKTFARPVRWIVARFGQETVRVDFAGVSSQSHTFGHRFAAPGPIEVQSIEQYKADLEAAFVIVDQSKRRKIIEDALAKVESDHNVRVLKDDALLDEVIHLVERPYVVVVTFDESYLELPDEVLISSMRSHQRYFSVLDASGEALTNQCVVVYNTPVRDPDVVRAGNLRVLKARLDDAKFFWAQDLKRPLSARLDDLESVTWLAQLGDLRQKSARIGQLAHDIATTLDLPEAQIHAARRAGQLAKADLVTLMVDEFTDLQGVMGGAYAQRTDEGELVAQAIKEHYMPAGADDDLPSSIVGACVSLADRLDTLVGIYGVGLIPKSSADPYGLRRAALGILRIIKGHQLPLKISQLLQLSHDVYAGQEKDQAFVVDQRTLLYNLFEFMSTRLKHALMADFGTDVVDAVLNVAADEVLAAGDRVAALAQLRHEPDFEPLAIGFKRVVNILSKQADAKVEIPEQVDVNAFVDAQEKALHSAYLDANTAVNAALIERDWLTACQALIKLKQPIDDFFDHVMVMTDDEGLKLNRLALLDALRTLFLLVANISMIQTER